MVALLKSGEYSSAELGDLFGVARSTVYRAAERDAARKRTQRADRGFNPLKRQLPAAPHPGDQRRHNDIPLAGRCPAGLPLVRDIASISPRPPTRLRNRS
jgi:hypothetical protein